MPLNFNRLVSPATYFLMVQRTTLVCHKTIVYAHFRGLRVPVQCMGHWYRLQQLVSGIIWGEYTSPVPWHWMAELWGSFPLKDWNIAVKGYQKIFVHTWSTFSYADSMWSILNWSSAIISSFSLRMSSRSFLVFLSSSSVEATKKGKVTKLVVNTEVKRIVNIIASNKRKRTLSFSL